MRIAPIWSIAMSGCMPVKWVPSVPLNPSEAEATVVSDQVPALLRLAIPRLWLAEEPVMTMR